MASLAVPVEVPEQARFSAFDEDYFEWEERQDDTPFMKHMVAGSIAGIAEHVLLLPIDIIKTHKQALKYPVHTATVILDLRSRSGGLRNLWRGGSVMAVGSVPAHALYFSLYEILNLRLDIANQSGFYFHKTALIGALCSLVHDLVIVPCETIKQRCQLSHIKPSQIFKDTIKHEGYRSLWRSLPVTFMMNFPYQAAVVSTNEFMKKLLTSLEVKHTFWTHFLCASIAGFTACMVTMPLDVLKTHLNTSRFLYPSTTKMKKEPAFDWRRMFRGLTPRVLTQTLAVGTSWSVYGLAKNTLTRAGQH